MKYVVEIDLPFAGERNPTEVQRILANLSKQIKVSVLSGHGANSLDKSILRDSSGVEVGTAECKP